MTRSALKVAARDLVKKLHQEEDADIRIGLVPYGEQINVGLANRNASWLSVPDDYSSSKTTTKTTGGGCYQPTTTTNVCKRWTEAGSRQVERDGEWFTETWSRHCSEYKRVNSGPKICSEPTTTTTTTVTAYKWYGCVGSRVANKRLVLDDLSPSIPYPGFVVNDKVQRCLTEIVPLTGEESTIQNAVAGMITSRSGYTPQTYIPAGLMWGINVLSKEQPYNQGLEYDAANQKPRKVIVLMTDGLNTRRVNLKGTLNVDYLKGSDFIGDTTSANSEERVETNEDTTTLCNYAKSKMIEIFTVAFKVDDGPAKTMLQDCATDAQHYYDASDPAALMAAFSGIAQSLSQVRLAR